MVLSTEGSPEFATILKVIHTPGQCLHVTAGLFISQQNLIDGVSTLLQ